MDSPAKIALTFPGQGSQYPGMAKVPTQNFPYTKAVYEEASEAIKADLLKLCEESSETLQLTRNAQPAILVTSYAWTVVLRQELDLKVEAAGGHSLGEYTALLSSGGLSLTDATKLVRMRGELMQSAVPVGRGKMVAVLGLDDESVDNLCELASEGENSLVVPANYNAPNQVVIAGHTTAVDRAKAIATSGTPPELKAGKVIELSVSAPFHCPLMKPVAEKFYPYLRAIAWRECLFPIVFNVDARPRSKADFSELLRDQLVHPVLWTSVVRTLHQHGCAYFVEPGPGRVLTGLVHRILDDGKYFSVDSTEGLKKLEKALREDYEVKG